MPFGQTQPPAHPYAALRAQQREQHVQRRLREVLSEGNPSARWWWGERKKKSG